METTLELNYYKEQLNEYLHSSFPELLDDHEFIQERSDSAAEAHEAAFLAGNPVDVCKEEANNALFQGLYFSKFSTLLEVLTKEFERELKDEQFRPFAIQMLAVCEPVFEKYELTDDFAYSADYDRLYTELTGAIAFWIEENGLPE